MKRDRRKWSSILWLMLVTISGTAVAAGVPRAGDLRADARRAEESCVPLLLEFSALSCDYCRLLEREVLNPTLLNREYDRRVLMRKLLIDTPHILKDFDGGKVTARQLADRYKVYVTPTLVFVDKQGIELTERMVGVTTLDFYGGYLDMALDASREALNQRRSCETPDL